MHGLEETQIKLLLFFHLKDDKFSYSKNVKNELIDVFGLLVQELVSYRLIRYESNLMQ